MSFLRPHFLAALLQLAPLTRIFHSSPNLAAAPALFMLRWVFGATASAVAGSVHASSGASGFTPASMRVTNGIRVTQAFTLTSANHGLATIYESRSGLPPGLSFSQRGQLTGTPTRSGIFNFRFYGTKLEDGRLADGGEATVPITVVGDDAPLVTNQPVSLTVQAGQDAMLTAGFSGDQPITLRWFKEDIEVRNATNATLVVTNAQPADAGRYRLRLVNDRGTVFSEFATLTVEASAPPPSITIQPVPRTVHQGETVLFNVTADGSALAFAWERDGSPVGTSSSLLVLTNVGPPDVGGYLVRITGAGGSTNSVVANLAVLAPLHLDLPTLSNNAIRLSFTGVQNRRYSIDSADSPDGAFSGLTEVPGNTNGAVFLDAAINDPLKVYRVRALE